MELPLFAGDDAFGWLSRVEHYFRVNGIREEEKLELILLTLEGHQVIQFYSFSCFSVTSSITLDMIPSYVKFGGTLRSLTTEEMYHFRQRIKEVIEGEATVHRCNAHVDFKEEYFTPYPAVVNDYGLNLHVERVGQLLLGLDNVHAAKKVMAGEDFAFYQEVIPGVLFSIGIRNEKVGSIHSPHSPFFFLDEEALPIGAAMLSAIAEFYLNDHSTV